MNNNINASWSSQDQKKIKNIFGPGYIVLKLDEDSISLARKKYEKLIDGDVSFSMKKKQKNRSLDQNSLMWSLYSVEAEEQNSGMSGGSDIMAMDLYESDLMEYAPRMILTTAISHWNILKNDYRVIWEKEIAEKIRAEIIISSSHWNVKEMRDWIDRIINRIAEHGLSENNALWLHQKFFEWKKHCYSKPDPISIEKEKYRKSNCICEATGKYIGNEGHIAHIQARGMGGNWSSDLDRSWNLLYLSSEAHIEVQHQNGWEEFCKKYPHLKNKVDIARKKVIETDSVDSVDDAIASIDSVIDAEK